MIFIIFISKVILNYQQRTAEINHFLFNVLILIILVFLFFTFFIILWHAYQKCTAEHTGIHSHKYSLQGFHEANTLTKRSCARCPHRPPATRIPSTVA